jgi:hypothetical protein
MRQSYSDAKERQAVEEEEQQKGAMQQSAGAAPVDRVHFGLSFNFIYADGSQRYTTSTSGCLKNYCVIL